MIYGLILAISVAAFGLWGSIKISASILIIGVLIALAYNYLPQLKEAYFRFKSDKTDTPATSSTQKISAVGKNILGALKKIVSWALILGLIAGVGLVIYCFLFPSTDTIYFTPNQWSRINHGWQKAFDLEEPGTYEIKVSGVYDKCFFRKVGRVWKKEWYSMPPNGRTWNNWPPAEFRRHMPLPTRSVGMIIAKADGKTIPVGYGRKIRVNKPTAVYLNINIPQNWTDVPGKTPADNFVQNRGSLRVTIEKDWAIFEKIAEILKSLAQYAKGWW